MRLAAGLDAGTRRNTFGLIQNQQLFLWLGSFPFFLLFSRYLGVEPAGKVPSLCLLLVAGLLVRREDLGRPARIIITGVGTLFAVYNVASFLNVPNELLQEAGLPVWAFRDGRYLNLVLLPLVLFRPGIAVLPLAFTWIVKKEIGRLSGIGVTTTDWLIVWEAAAYLIIFCAAVRLHDYLRPRHAVGAAASDWAFLSIVAVHFANYFYSGVGKILLGPAPWTWVVENPTYALIANAWQTGTYPLGAIPWLGATVYDISKSSILLINIATLAGQLFAIIALSRISWQKWLTVYFDIQHITIFILTGIFFWKWIVFNLLLIHALSTVRDLRITLRQWCMLAATMLSAPLFFHIVWLAWYDTHVVVDAHLQAILKDGSRIELPSSIALASSVTFAQSRVGRPFQGQANTGSLGATTSATLMRLAKDCGSPSFKESALWRTMQSGPQLDRLRTVALRLVRYLDEDEYIEKDLSRVNLYAHHMITNPFLYPKLRGLPLAAIGRIDYVVETVCTSIGGGLEGNVLSSASFPLVERTSKGWTIAGE